MSFTELPDDLPVPEDDGAADHLTGMAMPAVSLPSTTGGEIDVGAIGGTWVLYAYPKTGRPGVEMPVGWDDIPGARGCTPQACAFRDHISELTGAGARVVYGLSTQTTEYQREAFERLHLRFALLSDAEGALTIALNLPTMTVDGEVLLKRATLIIRDRVIVKVFYPVFPPDRNAGEVVAWLRENG